MSCWCAPHSRGTRSWRGSPRSTAAPGTTPVVADGRLLVRNLREMAAFDPRPPEVVISGTKRDYPGIVPDHRVVSDQRGTRPLGSIFGSISRGFQGTHGPRRAWKPPPRQAAALSGTGGRARGAGVGPAVRASVGAEARAGPRSSALERVPQRQVQPVAPQRRLCRCQIEPHRVPAAVEPFDPARAIAGLDDAGIRVPPGEIERRPLAPRHPQAGRQPPGQPRLAGARHEGPRLRERHARLTAGHAGRPEAAADKGAEGAERAHPQAGEIHIPGQDPGQRGQTTDTDC